MSGIPPSGEQFVIGFGDQAAMISIVGATLRQYQIGGRDVIDGFPLEGRSVDGRGQVLLPWPNRLGGGRYTFNGTSTRAPLNEPDRGNAIHGLVRWLPWELVSLDPSAVTLECALWPQPGYEWPVLTRLTYRVGSAGLVVSSEVTNRGDDAAPLGVGFHPYLTVGTIIDQAHLLVPAGTRVLADDDGLPTGREPVTGTDYDFRALRPIGPMRLDTAYTDLIRDEGGRAVAVLSGNDVEPTVRLWVDNSFGHLMVYTGDSVGDPERRRRAVAIEPMTCPPDAFRTGTDLLSVEPGATWRGEWGIDPT